MEYMPAGEDFPPFLSVMPPCSQGEIKVICSLSLSSSHFLSVMFTSISICGPNIMLSMCLVLIFVIRLMLEVKPILQRSQMPNVFAYYFHA